MDDEDLLNGEAAEEIPDNEVFVYPFQDSDSDDELWPLEELDSDDGLWSSEEEDSDDELWPPEELDSDEEVHLSEEQNSHEAPWATEQYREELRRSLSFALMESERKLGLYRVFTAVCITALLVYLATFSVYLGPLIDRLWWRCWKYTCCVVKHYYARLPELLDTILGCWECTCFMAEHYHERLLVLLDRV